MDSIDRLSRLTVVLHWLIAIPIIVLIGVGLYMTNYQEFSYYGIHKSTGIILFVLIIIRVLWRINQGWPEPVSKYSALEINLAKLIHWLLIIATILMPITGMISSGASGHGFGIFGMQLLSANPSAEDPKKVIPLSEFWAQWGEISHEILGYILIAAIFLHIFCAVKHHLIDNDATLLRMLGKTKDQ